MGLYQRQKDGNWYMDFTIHGVRVHKSTSTPNKKVAKLVMEKARSEVLERVLAPEFQQQQQQKKRGALSFPTLSEAFEITQADRWDENKSNETVYRTSKITKIIGDLPINEITGKEVALLKNTLRESGLARSTINRYLTHLKTALKHIQRVSPELNLTMPYIGLYTEPEGRIRVVTEDEEKKILSFYLDKKDRDMADLVQFLLDTGFRTGEARKLTYADIDFTNELIYSYADQNKGQVTKAVPMTYRVNKILESRKDMERPFPLTKHQIRHRWDKMKNALGLVDDEEFIPHCLRHTCASRLVQRGVDLYTVKAYLGHASIQVTERYAHLNPQNLRDAAKVL